MLIKRITLTGFMGAGKTTIGRLLAEKLGWEFVDTDDLVVSLSGRTIPELFAIGEPEFRNWERQAIATLHQRAPLVIATGAGAVIDPENRAELAAIGVVVSLDAPPEVLWERAGSDRGRPLSLDLERFMQLLETRHSAYASFPLRVDTHSRSPGDTACWLRDQLCGDAEQVSVELGARAYPIHVGPGALAALPELLGGTPSSCLLVTDDQVEGRYARPLLRGLQHAGWQAHLATVPAGEASKSLATAERLFDACVAAGLKRHHPIIALGGGVVGDLAGFVASTYLRGVPFVQAPTTLLAQIDASIGGKVGINHPLGKNLIGAFHQPRLVVADTLPLLTLPEREYCAGLAELIKHGAVLDAALFDLLEQEAARVRARDLPLLNHLIAWSCRLKAAVVREDERETPGGRRELLNFGHTVGHALEAAAGYGPILHGEAVAMGMVAEARLATARGSLKVADADRLTALLVSLGLPVSPPALPQDAIIEAMSRDKKNREKGVTVILPKGLGAGQAVVVACEEIASLIG